MGVTCKDAYFQEFSVEICCGSLVWRQCQNEFQVLVSCALSFIDVGSRATALGTCPVQADNTNWRSETSEVSLFMLDTDAVQDSITLVKSHMHSPYLTVMLN
jgi:hypothetical protein